MHIQWSRKKTQVGCIFPGGSVDVWQCLESQRRRGYIIYIQQLGDSHNYDTWRLDTNWLSSGTMIPLPVLYHQVCWIPFLSGSMPKLFAGYPPWKKTGHLYCYLYFSALFCLMHTPYHPRVCWLISASISTLAAKNTSCRWRWNGA